VATRRAARKFSRRETSTEFQHLHILMLLVFKAPSMKHACFWRFLLNSCVEFTSFKSFDSEVKSFYFGPMLPFAHNLSCKCASKPLSAISARSVICFLPPTLHLSKNSSRPQLRCRFLYSTVFTRFGCTPTQHFQSKPSRDFAPTEALTSEVSLLQNFRACKKQIPFLSDFWENNSRISW